MKWYLKQETCLLKQMPLPSPFPVKTGSQMIQNLTLFFKNYQLRNALELIQKEYSRKIKNELPQSLDAKYHFCNIKLHAYKLKCECSTSKINI